ncbi:MAG TPA: glycerol-3-phosphate dehydrogenase/oxidase [Anaerolineales bacterium]|nr:glycerol-3-phosphate dehydrogenase/oxidase [Anaerolineales bacterium]
MRRDIQKLVDQRYDVVIVGGGIYGACIAWDATQRGLSVALVERGDFGQETSANSLKTVHGGLRYLQDADLALVRMMIHERSALLRIAPHLVHPLPSLMPTYGHLMKSKPVMAVALKINDLVGFDRNRGLDVAQQLNPGKVISREDCLRLLPGLAEDGVTGGALWYDGQVYNTERLTLSFILSAAGAGAAVGNYVEAFGILQEEDRVTGIKARDTLSGGEFELRASVVVNAAGPWVNCLLAGLPRRPEGFKFRHSLAINLVTRQLIDGIAAGVPSRSRAMPKNGGAARSRTLFIAPWREYSIVGTYHLPYTGHPDELRLDAGQIECFLEEINSAYPGAGLALEDIRLVHKGFLPAMDQRSGQEVKLLRQGQIHDHRKETGLQGLISVVGVKYTSSRQIAEKTVDTVFRQLGKQPPECKTDQLPLHDGQMNEFGEYLSQQVRQASRRMKPDLVRDLVYSYGSEYPRLLRLIDLQAGGEEKPVGIAEIIRAVTLFAVRHEMAYKLKDVILRRSGIGSAGRPETSRLLCCVDVMAAELGWDQSRQAGEIAEVEAIYQPDFLRSNSGDQACSPLA